MTAPTVRIRAVVFDIGETLVDKSREYAGWARALGTTPHTFSAVFGATVVAGGGADDAIRNFAPDGVARYQELTASGLIPPPAEQDLYPGVRELLGELRAAGVLVGVAGNQPPGFGALLRRLSLPADVVATSDDWGLRKPDPRFFGRAVSELLGPRGDPGEVVYIGDQLDDDVVAAHAAGLHTVRVLQGPWGRLVRDAVIESSCLAVVGRVADVACALTPWFPVDPV